MKLTRLHYLLIVLVIAEMVFVAGLQIRSGSTAAVRDAAPPPPPSPLIEYREDSGQYQYINPLLFVETDQKSFTEFDSFDKLIASTVKAATDSRKAYSVSVYLRLMRNGHWTGYNESDIFEPSSLLKVAVMIAYLRTAANEYKTPDTTADSFLAQKLYYPGQDDSGQNYPPQQHLAPGEYSIKDLINDMIVNSDNVAKDVLINNESDQVEQVYKDFRLPQAIDDGAADYMTAKSYSVVFRTLYNSTYLPWDLSEKALQLLASTTFDQGLVAGVPAGTIVSHKFGEHTNLFPNGALLNHELHDCGIIYYPNHPYLLCVMTKGADFGQLEKVIASLSRLSYMWVDTTYHGKSI